MIMHRLARHALTALALPLLAVPATRLVAQATTSAPANQPAANPADVGSLDAIIAALYDVISGPAGQQRNWDRMRSLFIPGARLIPSSPSPGWQGCSPRPRRGRLHRASRADARENGFFEREISRKTDTFGTITHAFSTYESRRTKEDAKPFARGINSIQLVNDGTRWWIVTVFWDSERPNNPLPEKYLTK